MNKRNLLFLFLIIIFAFSLGAVQWKEGLLHAGGISTLVQMLKSIFQPDLSWSTLQLAFESLWLTLAYAVAGISIALVIAFIFGILASGILASSPFGTWLSFGVFRGILGFMRAIHELIWAWLFVAAIGLSPFAAIFALAIAYGGALGRVFADILKDVPKEPIDALKSSGASKLQILLYGYLPATASNLLSYAMYRFECALRSSAIMSFVGLGGLGYQIQLSLSELRYNEVWTYMFFLIVLVWAVDCWSSLLRNRLDKPNKSKLNFINISAVAAVSLIVATWLYMFVAENADIFTLFSAKNAAHGQKFIASLLGIGETNPAFLSAGSWKNALRLSYETLMISIIAIGFSSIGMLLTVIPAARNAAEGTLTLSRKWYNWLVFGMIRCIYIFSRSVPELVWAMLIVYILKPGILAGALALAFHNFGILGKLSAEVVEDLDLRPVRNLASSGATSSQLLLYGVLPSVLPKFITYILYRWEVIIRTTIVVGFVGAGGLGQQFKLSMSWFHYTDVTLILICYLLLVGMVDLLSEGCRRLIK